MSPSCNLSYIIAAIAIATDGAKYMDSSPKCYEPVLSVSFLHDIVT